MKNFGIKIIATEVKSIDEAVSLWMQGNLLHIKDRVC
jgi:predicted Fe-Mo cluster-binding NifX family protein